MLAHLKMHSGEKSYKCNQCDHLVSSQFQSQFEVKGSRGEIILGLPSTANFLHDGIPLNFETSAKGSLFSRHGHWTIISKTRSCDTACKNNQIGKRSKSFWKLHFQQLPASGWQPLLQWLVYRREPVVAKCVEPIL